MGETFLLEVRNLLRGPGATVADVADRGLDHGAYVPLKAMYPDADVPVLQLSMPTLQPRALMDIGRKLAPLREEGVLIIGSGFFTHNLRAMTTDDEQVYPFTAEFDDWGRETLAARDLDALLDFEHKAPAAKFAHPRADHFAPLFVSLGAGENDLDALRTVIDGYWFGMARRSIQLG
ncbi:class III extradiol ring-cleavage dioxygenase [Nocardia sp. NPDC049190]|uniref:DODA-type extradiol aromatic ring-opening family dioxygenase n=1 Tax=Nocardia sp. NPDC049190 TaxID=3155650 RepID=UPI00340C0982